MTEKSDGLFSTFVCTASVTLLYWHCYFPSFLINQTFFPFQLFDIFVFFYFVVFALFCRFFVTPSFFRHSVLLSFRLSIFRQHPIYHICSCTTFLVKHHNRHRWRNTSTETAPYTRVETYVTCLKYWILLKLTYTKAFIPQF